MIPVDPGETYGELVVYAANQPEYNPLPSRIDAAGGSFTLWELTPEERGAILDGARVGLRILTFGQPLQPVILAVEGTPDWPYVRTRPDTRRRRPMTPNPQDAAPDAQAPRWEHIKEGRYGRVYIKAPDGEEFDLGTEPDFVYLSDRLNALEAEVRLLRAAGRAMADYIHGSLAECDYCGRAHAHKTECLVAGWLRAGGPTMFTAAVQQEEASDG